MLAQSVFDQSNVLCHVRLFNRVLLLQVFVACSTKAYDVASAAADTAGDASWHLFLKHCLKVLAFFEHVELENKHETVAHILLEFHLLIGEWPSVQNRS